MIYHVSIEADDPRHTAGVLAEIMGGVAAPFPHVGKGSWVALAGDAHGTLIEVYPRGTELHQGEGHMDGFAIAGTHRRHGAVHLAIGTELAIERIYAIGAHEGWTTKYCRRGGAFGVIEFWIDNCLMIEVLTDEMQREYRDAITVQDMLAMVAEASPAETQEPASTTPAAEARQRQMAA
ncbi:hypothetical protein SH591_05430 [Sphingomonas sp. LY54]|uniref:hypothetical protein n=1 Tax=Sphingomonas sp. LY54 TaxID=3095343 RepID=UPI002D765D72|nr:hypothetical protein [Sphingomonas sp. LY54]WRP29619.1 hypothetical protein SH591_05430 [Sphingomonas sp. LY54]